MITIQDIQAKQFSKAVRGYNQDEVNEFLNEIMVDYERLNSENAGLKAQLDSVKEKLASYRETEGAVLKTLEAAKGLMNDISASAEKRASILVKNAELDADLKQRQARDNVERLKEEEARLKARVAGVKTKLRSFLEAELERFDGLSEDIFGTADPVKLSGAKTAASKPYAAAPVKEESEDDIFKTIMNLRSEDK